MKTLLARLVAALVIATAVTAGPAAVAAEQTLLNASYDVAREFYKDYDAAFVKHWKQTIGQDVVINQSHDGSSKQARSVADGLEADVVTMNSANDIDFLASRGVVPADWAKRFPEQRVADLFDDAVPRSEGQPERASRTGTTSRSPACRS